MIAVVAFAATLAMAALMPYSADLGSSEPATCIYSDWGAVRETTCPGNWGDRVSMHEEGLMIDRENAYDASAPGANVPDGVWVRLPAAKMSVLSMIDLFDMEGK